MLVHCVFALHLFLFGVLVSTELMVSYGYHQLVKFGLLWSPLFHRKVGINVDDHQLVIPTPTLDSPALLVWSFAISLVNFVLHLSPVSDACLRYMLPFDIYLIYLEGHGLYRAQG